MNDFTKDDLEELFLAYNVYCTATGSYLDLILQNKIKSMIDSYCEHIWMTFLQDQNNEPFVDKCFYCNELRVSNNE